MVIGAAPTGVIVPVVLAATVRASDALKLGDDSPAIVPLYRPSRVVGPVTPESFLHAAPDANTRSAVALRSGMKGRMNTPAFFESGIRHGIGDELAGERPTGRSAPTLRCNMHH